MKSSKLVGTVLFFLLALFILVALIIYFFQYKQQVFDKREINEKTLTIRTVEYSNEGITLQYPQLEGFEDAEKEEKINGLIKAHILESNLKVAEELPDTDKLILNMDYEITMNTPDVLSILYKGFSELQSDSETYYYGCEVAALTIDLLNAKEMSLTDFVTIDKELVRSIKESVKVVGGAPQDWEISHGALIDIVQQQNEENIIQGLQEGWSYYTFCITPKSVIVSIAIPHSEGDYVLIEVEPLKGKKQEENFVSEVVDTQKISTEHHDTLYFEEAEAVICQADNAVREIMQCLENNEKMNKADIYAHLENYFDKSIIDYVLFCYQILETNGEYTYKPYSEYKLFWMDVNSEMRELSQKNENYEIGVVFRHAWKINQEEEVVPVKIEWKEDRWKITDISQWYNDFCYYHMQGENFAPDYFTKEQAEWLIVNFGIDENGKRIPITANVDNNGYILANSSQRLLSEEEIDGLSVYESYLAVQEIYARHGKKFSDSVLQQHFSALEWYKPYSFIFSKEPLSEIENENIKKLNDKRLLERGWVGEEVLPEYGSLYPVTNNEIGSITEEEAACIVYQTFEMVDEVMTYKEENLIEEKSQDVIQYYSLGEYSDEDSLKAYLAKWFNEKTFDYLLMMYNTRTGISKDENGQFYVSREGTYAGESYEPYFASKISFKEKNEDRVVLEVAFYNYSLPEINTGEIVLERRNDEWIITSISHPYYDALIKIYKSEKMSMEDIIEACIGSDFVYSKRNSEEWTIFECVPNGDSFYAEPSTIKVKQDFSLQGCGYEEAKALFSEVIDYYVMWYFESPQNEYGITDVFEAVADNGSKDYYLLKRGDNYYWLLVDGKNNLSINMFSHMWSDDAAMEYRKQVVECIGGKKNRIISNKNNQENRAEYEIYFDNLNEADYTATLLIDSHQYTWIIYSGQEEKQRINWESKGQKKYPLFLDANKDGYTDMMVATLQGTSYDVHDLYIWKKESEGFEKVIYEDWIGELEVKEDCLWNWQRLTGGFNLQTLTWNGDKLVLISEEEIMPEE
ncbi:MAG: YARHG domain-containing protein [Lachnospiraceae bacterium]|nr:YARHG domain-containing protein [Lachnospiraceae bacterium]